MADTQQLIDTLKRLLKARGITYAAMSRSVGLSEASVKRLFSARTFTLARLDQFCAALDIDIFELARLARGGASVVREMSDSQEAALARDAKLLSVFYLLLSDWSAQDILARYVLTRAELTRLLVRLDRLELIELMPEDRVRLKVPKRLRLHPGGPIDRVHGKRVLVDFTAAEFDRCGGRFRFEYRELSQASYELLKRKLDQLTSEMIELAELDGTLPPAERTSCGMLIAIRPWSLSMVTGLAPRTAAPARSVVRNIPR